MMEPVMKKEGMTLKLGERVDVYYREHDKQFSIRAIDMRNPDRGKIVASSSYVQLSNVSVKNYSGKVVFRGTYSGAMELRDLANEQEIDLLPIPKSATYAVLYKGKAVLE